MRAHEISSTPADQFVSAFEQWLPHGLTADIEAEDDRLVFIEYIEGRGYGIVDKLCELADKFGVTLTLAVDMYHQYDGGKLVPYYQSKGFAIDGYNGSECFDADGNFDLSMMPEDDDGEYFHGMMGMKREPRSAISESTKNSWKPGETAYFEYHCNRSHDSEDAPAWYRSHQTVTVLGIDYAGNGRTLDQRLDRGEPRSYRVRFPDGLEWAAFEDELFTSPNDLTPGMGPPDDSPLTEAPIEDFQYIDHSDRQHPKADLNLKYAAMDVGNSFPDEDRRAIENPKWQAKLFKQFENSYVPINLYLFNAGSFEHRDTRTTTDGDIHNDVVSHPGDPGLSGMAGWSGAYTPMDFDHTFGFLPPEYEDRLNILMTQNWGDKRIPLTPWIVAHRIIHALMEQRSTRLKADHFFPMEDAFNAGRVLNNTMSRSYFHQRDKKWQPLDWSEEDTNDYYQATGTFKSARDRKIARSGEFIIEMATQYLLFGEIRLNLDWCKDQKDLKEIMRWKMRFEAKLDHGFMKARGALIVF